MMIKINSIYIAGPVTEVQAFSSVAAKWQRAGWKVIPPAGFRKCIEQLLTVQAIVMLKGWKESKEATLEHMIALELGLIIYYEDEDVKNQI